MTDCTLAVIRSSLLGDSNPAIRLDDDMSTHSDMSSTTHSEYQDSTRGGGGAYRDLQPYQPSASRNPSLPPHSTSQQSKPPTSAIESASSLLRLSTVLHADEMDEVDTSLQMSPFAAVPPTKPPSTNTAAPAPSTQRFSAPVTDDSAGDAASIQPTSMVIATAPSTLPDEEDDSLPL